jgi:hypothetical protein
MKGKTLFFLALLQMSVLLFSPQAFSAGGAIGGYGYEAVAPQEYGGHMDYGREIAQSRHGRYYAGYTGRSGSSCALPSHNCRQGNGPMFGFGLMPPYYFAPGYYFGVGAR